MEIDRMGAMLNAIARSISNEIRRRSDAACRRRAGVVGRHRRSTAQQVPAAPATRTIRASASRPACATPASGAQHGADREPAEAGRLLRSEGAGRRRRRRPSATPRRAAEPDRRRPPPSIRSPSNRLGLRELRPRVQRQPRVRRQLPRLQHLRHRAPEQAEAARVGRLPRRPGRRVGPRQPAVHVGGADARPPRLRHAGRADAGQRRALPRRPHLRHHRPQQAEAGGGGADLPRLAHAHAGAPIRRTRRTSTSTDPAPSSVRSAEELAGCSGSNPKEDPNTRSSAST